MKIFLGKLLYAVVSVFVTSLVSAGYSGEYHTFLVVATMGVCIIMMPSRWEKDGGKNRKNDSTEE